MASAVLLAGCNGDSQVEITLNNAASAILGTRPNPNKELTLAQGKKLIAEIRKDPKRVEKLTIQERRFLAKAMNAGDEQAIEVP